MKERAFNARTDDVRAILAGATVFRRLLTKLPANRSDMAIHHIGRCHYSGRWTFYDENNNCHSCNGGIRSPFGAPGDRLWIREAWAGGTQLCAYKADGAAGAWMPDGNGGRNWWPHERLFEGAKSGFLLRKEYGDRWRSASAMPRWASRLVLEVVGVEVEKSPQGWAWVVTFRRDEFPAEAL